VSAGWGALGRSSVDQGRTSLVGCQRRREDASPWRSKNASALQFRFQALGALVLPEDWEYHLVQEAEIIALAGYLSHSVSTCLLPVEPEPQPGHGIELLEDRLVRRQHDDVIQPRHTAWIDGLVVDAQDAPAVG
jgi:hypothetical protein